MTTVTHEGTLFISSKGEGFVRVKGIDDAIEIAKEQLGTGLHGDLVTVEVLGTGAFKQTLGRIIEIKKRAKVGCAGVVHKKNGIFCVLSSDPKMYTPIEIADIGEAQEGDKVFAVITEWTDALHTPKGKITHILGKPLEHNAEMVGIALEKGFDTAFPKAVEDEAHALKTQPIRDLALRRDMRNHITFTIDPVDAKDFDDALSVQYNEDGTVTIGVHIADVSYYVQPGTALDEEAYKRATSVYLVDRTIPMLPETLSNDLCSLNPHEDKLTMSAVFTMDMHGTVINEWYGRTIIHSDRRFSYEEAQDILTKKEGTFYREINTLNIIAKALSKKRFINGAISLDQEEIRFELDAKGVPVRAYKKIRQDTNHLIEEFMLLANRLVAEFITKGFTDRPFVYRIHDVPDKDRMHELYLFLKKLGYPVRLVNGVIPSKEINRILEQLEGKDEKQTVHSHVIRAMAKAIYSTKNIGHYGLAFEYYTHFTSPIRRYPDTVVHRLVQLALEKKTIPKEIWSSYEHICQHASQREKEAAEAERASIKYKQVEYMSYRIGQIFDGIVTGVSRNGIFVEEKESKSEGMVRLRDLGKDFFSFNEKENAIVGRASKKTFRIGDAVRIKVFATNQEKRIIDYILV